MGPVVQFRDADGNLSDTDMPLALFKATTSNKDLLVKLPDGLYEVQLPNHTNPDALKFFLTHMNNLTSEQFLTEIPFPKRKDLSLHLCSVAEDLSMSKYTQYIFNAYYYTLMNSIPGPDDVDAIGKVNTPLGNKLFKTVAHRLAKLAWDGEHPNIAGFKAYLAKNPRLAAIVNDVNSKREAAAKKQARLEERHRKEEEAAERLAKEREKQEKREAAAKKEQLAKDKKKWTEQKKKDTEIRARVMEKKRLGQPLTREEAAMHYVMYGKRVPV